MEDVLWERYPFVCPYCLSTECQCTSEQALTAAPLERLKVLRQTNRKQRPSRLRDWQRMFGVIYGNTTWIADVFPGLRDDDDRSRILLTTSRLFEEIAELAEAIRLEHVLPTAVGAELADVFAWLMAIANDLDRNRTGRAFDIEAVLWSQYPGRCSYCQRSTCICPNDRVRPSLRAAAGSSDDTSGKDPVTNLPRREVALKEMDDLLVTIPLDESVGIVLADLDHFKAVNDEYGHEAGDFVLAKVAGVLERCALRHGGRVFRWGGEEFLIVLPNSIPVETRACAERARVDLSLGPIRPPSAQTAQLIQTASFGFVTLYVDPSRKPGEQLMAAVDAADNALYAAKDLGRNRVEEGVSPGPAPSERKE